MWERRVRRELFDLAATRSRCTQRSYSGRYRRGAAAGPMPCGSGARAASSSTLRQPGRAARSAPTVGGIAAAPRQSWDHVGAARAPRAFRACGNPVALHAALLQWAAWPQRCGRAQVLWERRVRRELFSLAATRSRCTQRSYPACTATLSRCGVAFGAHTLGGALRIASRACIAALGSPRCGRPWSRWKRNRAVRLCEPQAPSALPRR